eukprot:CAMPEP_0119300654 /NCGR_PEP_ID=MMETSP1333-20130426/2570_1 /TAXON_ID=418940 /ORGANISM="Scyphosphaera apsteinii, Strain RCC1455" /LENGTH=359 /DNA_ID=CAMNT_0007302499 /DNA_START=1 /DNA_END=1080 /DNA_ORIENTATION=+
MPPQGMMAAMAPLQLPGAGAPPHMPSMGAPSQATVAAVVAEASEAAAVPVEMPLPLGMMPPALRMMVTQRPQGQSAMGAVPPQGMMAAMAPLPLTAAGAPPHMSAMGAPSLVEVAAEAIGAPTVTTFNGKTADLTQELLETQVCREAHGDTAYDIAGNVISCQALVLGAKEHEANSAPHVVLSQRKGYKAKHVTAIRAFSKDGSKPKQRTHLTNDKAAYLVESVATALEVQADPVHVAYCAKRISHAAFEEFKIGKHQGGCRRALNTTGKAIVGSCLSGTQLKGATMQGCFYPKAFECRCTPGRNTDYAAWLSRCTCNPVEFQAAVDAERRSREEATKTATAAKRAEATGIVLEVVQDD